MTTLLNLTTEELAIVMQDYPKYKSTVCYSCRQPLHEEDLILKTISYPTYFTPADYVSLCPHCNRPTELDDESIEEFDQRYYA